MQIDSFIKLIYLDLQNFISNFWDTMQRNIYIRTI